MLKMKWTMDNEGRLVATWTGRHQSYVARSYLTEETAVHTGGARMSAKAWRWTRLARVWNWMTERVREFAGEFALPQWLINSKITGPIPINKSQPVAAPIAIGVGRRKSRAVKVACLSAVSLLVATAVAWADVGGRISGAVTDPSGGAVAGANVMAVNTATGARLASTTNEEGVYSFPVLPVGHYEIEIKFAGFNSTGGQGSLSTLTARSKWTRRSNWASGRRPSPSKRTRRMSRPRAHNWAR